MVLVLTFHERWSGFLFVFFNILYFFSVYVIQGVSSGSPSSDSQHLLLCLGLASANEAGFSLFDPIRLKGDGRAAQRKARGESFVTANGAFLSP